MPEHRYSLFSFERLNWQGRLVGIDWTSIKTYNVPAS